MTLAVGAAGSFAASADETPAFGTAGGGTVTRTPSTPVSIAVGQGAIPIGTVAITLNDGTPGTTGASATPTTTGTGWSSGDTLTLQLTSDSAGALPICDGTLSAPTVTAANAQSIGLAGVTVAAGKSAAGLCGGRLYTQVLTLPAPPNDASTTTFTLSGMQVTPGSQVANGSPIYLTVTASSGTPFDSGSASKSLVIATLSTATVSIPKVIGVPVSTLSAPIGDITVTDLVGGTTPAVNQSLKISLVGGDLFQTAGTLTTPTGVTASPPSETLPSATLTYGLSGKGAANGTYTISGAKVSFSAKPGVHNIRVATTPAGTSTSPQLGPDVPFAYAVSTQRFAGTDRFATAADLYNESFLNPTTPHSVVIANGADFPDALSADFLASELKTGILLTDPTTLSPAVRLELTNDNITKVFLVGGTSAISAAEATEIGAIHVLDGSSNPLITVVRYNGADRYGTNHSVDDAVSSVLGPTTAQTFNTALIATGTSFADALAAGPMIYSAGIPLVLTDPNTLVPSALQSLKDLGVKQVIILGGTTAVSATVETALVSAGLAVEYRIAGEDRTETASFIAQWAAAGLPSTPAYKALAALPGWDPTTVFLARGDSFADSLAAGPAAGFTRNSILLTTNPTVAGPGIADYFAAKGSAVDALETLGGDSALSSSVVTSVLSSLATQTIGPMAASH